MRCVDRRVNVDVGVDLNVTVDMGVGREDVSVDL